jgi:hypothetical protein
LLNSKEKTTKATKLNNESSVKKHGHSSPKKPETPTESYINTQILLGTHNVLAPRI